MREGTISITLYEGIALDCVCGLSENQRGGSTIAKRGEKQAGRQQSIHMQTIRPISESIPPGRSTPLLRHKNRP